MRVNLLFMSPIILKYLPFCASQLPVFLRCDKRLPAHGLNPFLLRSNSGSNITQNPIFLLKSATSNFFLFLFFFFFLGGSGLFRVVPLGIIWAFDQVSVSLFNILFQSMFVCLVCAFDLLGVWLLSLERSNTHPCLCSLYCIACAVWGEGVCSVSFSFLVLRAKEMKFNAIWIMEYVSLPTVCCSECAGE